MWGYIYGTYSYNFSTCFYGVCYEEYNSAVNDYVTSKKEYYNVSEIK